MELRLDSRERHAGQGPRLSPHVSEEDQIYSFIHPMRIGALIAAGERTGLDRFDRLGFFTGTAFQIQDDVLNLIGDRRYGEGIGPGA